ncbi:MAG: caspase family protein [Planctomycetales bacterium]|nr:caspase family protein [Planctomycetales bacterium]
MIPPRHGAGAVLLALAAGCAGGPVPPLLEDPALAALRAEPPVPVRIAVAPPRVRPRPPPEHAGSLEWTEADAGAAIVEALRAAGFSRRVRPVAGSAPEGAAGDEALADAWTEGDDLLLEVEVTRFEAAYVGTNGWFLPNLLLWIELVWPAWFVPDEDYEVRVEGTARLRAVATGRTVWESPVSGSAADSFNDFERGFTLLGSLSVPSGLDAGNWLAIGKVLREAAVRSFQVDLATRLSRGLREAAATPAFAAATRQTLALLVGCGQYDHPGLHNLKYPVADARALREWLRAAGVLERQIRVLADDQATGARLRSEIRDFLAARARPGDRVLLSFAGYAGPDGRGGAALLPYDADPRRLAETSIPLGDLASALASVPDAEALLLLDAGLGGTEEVRWASCGLPPPDPARVAAEISSIASRPVTAVLWACRPGEGAAEVGERRHGLLTLNWLHAAARAPDRDGDGRVSVEEAFRVASRGVQMHAMLSGRVQTPRVYGAGGGFPVPRPSSRDASADGAGEGGRGP